MCNIENRTVTIWPNGKTSGGPVIELSPDTGLVGYPTMDYVGVNVTCLFNPNIMLGSEIKLTTSISALNGQWFVLSMRHVLEAQLPGGQWFTRAFMTRQANYLPGN
jgi:hypothetical protein